MARHYTSESQRNNKRGKKTVVILLSVLAGAAIIAAGIFVWAKFFVQPSVDPPRYQATSAETETAETPTEASSIVKAQQYLAGMSTREKICQLFIVTPEVLTGEYGVYAAGDVTKAALNEYPVGGVIYFSDNLIDAAQTKTMIANTQSFSKIPLFIGVDEEGGTVARCADKLGTTAFSDMYTYRSQGTQTAHDNAAVIARDLAQYGFNLDFAPVADVWSNPDNTVIAERAYSDNFQVASELVSAAVGGFHDGGVLCTLKHFPGHGDTAEDSHAGFAFLDKTAEELKANELIPFQAGIEAGADMVMVGHLTVPSMDDAPATLSKTIVPTLLRQELGYDGVVITDSMTMGAITEHYDHSRIVQGLFNADIDLILCPDDLGAYVTEIEKALSSGAITEEQLNKKLERILKLKIERNMLNL